MYLYLRFFFAAIFYLLLWPTPRSAAQKSTSIVTEQVDWETFKTLTAPRIAQMPIDDPLLRAAYAQVFLRSGKPTDWQLAVRGDLLRRGDSATPLLLSLFAENPESEFRANLMSMIDLYPTIAVEPFLKAARLLFQDEGFKLPPRTCYQMAQLFEKHGNGSDLRVLQQFREHPVKEVAFVIAPNIERMKERLLRDGSAATLPQTPSPTAVPATAPSPPDIAPSFVPLATEPLAQTTPFHAERKVWPWLWIAGVAALIVIFGWAFRRFS